MYSITASSANVDVHDFIEFTATCDPSTVLAERSPFALHSPTLHGIVTDPAGLPTPVSGFCDSDDGSVLRLRFSPRLAGPHSFEVSVRASGSEDAASGTLSGTFLASDAGRKGQVIVDPAHPFHFQWSGTGEHFHYNGTTAYSLLSLSEPLMERAIDRLADLGVNRIRVTLSLRVPSGREWCENVDPTDDFTFRLNPWQAERPDSVEDPGWDTSRFNVPFWQKAERMLRRCRKRDLIVSVIFYTDGRRAGVYPFTDDPAGANEQAYYRYAANRFGAFSNVMWDITNEWMLFRDEPWVKTMGAFLKGADSHGRLISVHGHGDFRFRQEPWADFAIFQGWDEWGGNAYMTKNRQEQAATGRPIPQVNEEYGYEDHYPVGWGEGRVFPARNADSRRRLAWEIALAGGYQTTGERPLSFTDPTATDSPVGGWLNGLGADDSTEMLDGNRRIVEFFAPLDCRTFTPANERVTCDKPAFCTARDTAIVVYLTDGSAGAAVALEPGTWSARWFDPLTGQYRSAGQVAHQGGSYVLPPCPTPEHDAVLLLSA